MMEDNKNTEPLEETRPIKPESISKESITKHLPFVLFLSFLMVMYIFFTHRTERKARQITNLQKEVKDLYSEYVTLETQILNESRSSKLEEIMLKQGIKPATNPAVLIK